MSANITSLGQDLAEIATTAAINIGAKDNSEKLARAMTANSVGQIFSAAGQGNLTQIDADIDALVSSIKDPALHAVAAQLAANGKTLLNAGIAAAQKTPFLGTTVDAVFQNIGTGMTTIAQKEIAAYSPPAKS